jgi:hypothetical protein
MDMETKDEEPKQAIEDKTPHKRPSWLKRMDDEFVDGLEAVEDDSVNIQEFVGGFSIDRRGE